MKLIEKKCPNCGAALEFSEKDKSCKCDYCHRSFEIERDNKVINDDSRDNVDAYNLIDSESAKKVAKTGLTVFAVSSIIPMISVFIIIVVFGIIYFNVIRDNNYTISDFETETVATNIADFSNTDLKKISDNSSYDSTSVKGENSNNYSYSAEDNEVYKYILAYKDDKNYFYVVRKVLYINFFNQDDKKTVYVPVKYENVVAKLDNYNQTQEILNGMSIDAPTFYLNDKKSSYIRGGYSDYNKFIQEKINPLKEQGYKITEK